MTIAFSFLSHLGTLDASLQFLTFAHMCNQKVFPVLIPETAFAMFALQWLLSTGMALRMLLKVDGLGKDSWA